eukprot:1596731-Rhodomonas_salina.1
MTPSLPPAPILSASSSVGLLWDWQPVPVPKQTNSSDCGLFVLKYVTRFVADFVAHAPSSPSRAAKTNTTAPCLLASYDDAQSERAQQQAAVQSWRKGGGSREWFSANAISDLHQRIFKNITALAAAAPHTPLTPSSRVEQPAGDRAEQKTEGAEAEAAAVLRNTRAVEALAAGRKIGMGGNWLYEEASLQESPTWVLRILRLGSKLIVVLKPLSQHTNSVCELGQEQMPQIPGDPKT